MKKKFLRGLDFVISKLTQLRLKLYQRWNTERAAPKVFESLSPTELADEDNHYYNALEWALSNRKKERISNIAITGPYGSGKSSILKSFQKKYKKKDLHFLHISLATFKEEVDSEKGDNGANQDKAVGQAELLRLIEFSILQQIFYREEDKAIPDSRFKKIKSFGAFRLTATSFGLLLFVIALCNFFVPDFVQSIFKDFPFSAGTKDVLHYGTRLVLAIGFFLALWKSVPLISSVAVNTLKIHDAEISFGEGVNKSVLNNHLDEILYFFEVTRYNVVIIEDLDRFQQTEIFTKLREINLVLNSSEKTKHKHIVFIYAVRDDMFKDLERTKFFDFIIPVIPIINSSNSKQILYKKRDTHKYEISDELIEDIALFVDDMRLLHNITNEFHMYRQKLDSNLDQNKLLSMIVYKNLYPYDFTLLSKNDGVLYKFLQSKDRLINQKITALNERSSQLRPEIKNLESARITDIQDLRRIYIFEATSHLEDFDTFILPDGSRVSLQELLADDKFEYFRKDALRYRRKFGGLYSPIPFNEIEKRIGTKAYLERKAEIDSLDSGKLERLKSEIQDLERAKLTARDSKLKDLLKTASADVFGEKETPGSDLIKVLLRYGYIAEDYVDYISVFHEGSISRSDNQFLLCVKSQKKLEPTYKLNKIAKVIQMINPADFETEYVLNFDLLDYLLAHPGNSEAKVRIFRMLGDQSGSSVNFIDKYIDRTPKIREFVFLLCRSWPDIWNYIDSSVYLDDRKQLCFKYIIEFSDLQDIELIANRSGLAKRIANSNDFLEITPDKQRLQDVIRVLAVQFENIELKSAPADLSEYIYVNDFYRLNVNMIRSVLEYKGKFEHVPFHTENYSAIKNSKLSPLNERIENDIEQYVINVFLNILSNVSEPEDSFSELLNKDISDDAVHGLVKHVHTRVRLEHITNVDRRKIILKHGKTPPEWSNLLVAYRDAGNVLSEDLIGYINVIGNAKELSKLKISADEDVYSEFWEKVLSCEDLSDEAYEAILKSNVRRFSTFSVGNLSHEKVASLIRHKVFEFSKANYDAIKENFSDLHVRLLENNRQSFLENVASFQIDGGDLELILISSIFSSTEKSTVIGILPESVILTHPKNLNLIGGLIVKDDAFQTSDGILSALLLTSEVPVDRRVKIFIAKQSQVPNELSMDFLNALGEPYRDINVNGKRPLLARTDYNFKLAEILVSKSLISGFDDEQKGIRITTFQAKNGPATRES